MAIPGMCQQDVMILDFTLTISEGNSPKLMNYIWFPNNNDLNIKDVCFKQFLSSVCKASLHYNF